MSSQAPTDFDALLKANLERVFNERNGALRRSCHCGPVHRSMHSVP